MSVDAVLLEGGSVLRLVLNRPPANILTIARMTKLRTVLARHRDDGGLRMVLLRGAGEHFSFGASVEEHKREHAAEMLSTFHGLVRDLAAYPVPVAAAVDGRCLGGAFEIVLACHLVFASASTSFACPEVKLGVVPPVLATLGPHRLGAPVAERLTITGDKLDVQTANALGFVCSVAPSGVDLERHVLDWYRRMLAPLSAFALREATHAARHGSGLLQSLGAPLEHAEKRYLDRVLPSHDSDEGIKAFLEKRAPHWVNA